MRSSRPTLRRSRSAISLRRSSTPSAFSGTHWFNPPQWVPCVEVIPGPETTKAVIERAVGFLDSIGKSPVTVGDAAGFVANRIQFAMFKEAVSCVAEGVAEPEEVDRIVSSSFGFRLPFFGPFAIADMAGLDVYAGAYDALEEDLGTEIFRAGEAPRTARRGPVGYEVGRRLSRPAGRRHPDDDRAPG